MHIVARKVYVAIFGVLLLLTFVTVQVAFVNLGGRLNAVVALSIAVVKALLVILYFMHVRHSSRLIWVAVVAAFFWLGILVVLTLSDYLTRRWLIYP